MIALFAIVASASPQSEWKKIAVLCVEEESAELGGCISFKMLTEIAADNLESVIPVDTIIEKEFIRGKKLHDVYGSIVVTNPGKIDQDLSLVTDGDLLMLVFSTAMGNIPINLSRLGGKFEVVAMTIGFVAAKTLSSETKPLWRNQLINLNKELFNINKLKLQSSDYVSSVTKAFTDVFNAKLAGDEESHGFTLTCGDDGTLDDTVESLSLIGNSYHMDRECHVPFSAFVVPPFQKPEDAAKLHSDYCLMSASLWSINEQTPGLFNCKDVGLTVTNGDTAEHTSVIELENDGVRLSDAHDFPYKKSWMSGDLSLLYTSDILSNSGGSKFTVKLTVPKTATAVTGTLNISAQTVSDYTIMEAGLVVNIPGMKHYDDPHLEIIFDEDSDWSIVDLDLILETRNEKRLRITGEQPKSVRISKRNIDQRHVVAEDTVATPVSNTNDDTGLESGEGTCLSTGVIAGISAGCAVFVGIIVAVVILFVVPKVKCGGDDDGKAAEEGAA